MEINYTDIIEKRSLRTVAVGTEVIAVVAEVVVVEIVFNPIVVPRTHETIA